MRLVPAHRMRCDEGGDDLLRTHGRIMRVLDLGQQHHELITALTADRVGVP